MGFEPPAEGAARSGPAFAPILNCEAKTLALLHLPLGATPFDELERILIEHPDDAARELAALLGLGDWRAHLVAGLALLVREVPDGTALLWRRLDEGSYVAPQLAAIAFVIDPEFDARAAERLSGEGPVKSRAALGALYRRLLAPRLALLARLADPALTRSQEGRDGARYAIEWLERLASVAPPEIAARFVRPLR